MMKGQLKQQVATSTGWTLGEKILTALVQFVVRVLILRMLFPDDLKVVAILLAISSFALVIVDSGFSQMLVRKQQPSSRDFKSVFLFNLVTACVVYGLLVLLSPTLASYYAMPILRETAPVFFLMIPINALGVIQWTVLTRNFAFARLSKIVFTAQLVSGLAAVMMAYVGMGVWALVWQQVLLMAVRSALLWWRGGWKPQGEASMRTLGEMAPYSMSLLASDLVTAIYNKVPQLIIGKVYADATLGYYDQAIKLKDLPVQSAMQSVQQVTFPALSKIAHEQPRFAESFRQVLMVVAYAIFPVMLGMAAVAHDLFAVLLGEQWMPTVPLFEAFMTVAFALSIPHSVEAVVWALVVSAAFDCVVNLWAALPLAQLSWRKTLRTLLPIALVSIAMYAATCSVRWWWVDPSLGRLIAQIAVGVGVYGLLSWLFRLEALQELVALAMNQLKR